MNDKPILAAEVESLWRVVQAARDYANSAEARRTNQTQAAADEAFWKANRKYEAAKEAFDAQPR